MKNVIVVDGTVGCGKTSLAEILAEELGEKLYLELGNPDTERLLDRYYAKKTRWGFTMQIHFLNERFKQIKEIWRNNGGLLDRSIFGDRIFAEMLAEDLEDGGEGMTWEEYRTYSTLLDSMLEHALPPTLMIYLRCSTDTAISRINQRDRGLESQVDRKYWERLNFKYDQWFEGYDHSEKIVIDVTNIDFVNNPEDRAAVLAEIKSKLLAMGRIKAYQTTLGDHING